jgi:hypothetical protein
MLIGCSSERGYTTLDLVCLCVGVPGYSSVSGIEWLDTGHFSYTSITVSCIGGVGSCNLFGCWFGKPILGPTGYHWLCVVVGLFAFGVIW